MDSVSRLIRNAVARGFGWRIGAALAVGLLGLFGAVTESKAYGSVAANSNGQGYRVNGQSSGPFSSYQSACQAYGAEFAATQSPRAIDSTTVNGGGVTRDCVVAYTLTEGCCGGVPAGTKDSITVIVGPSGSVSACPVNSSAVGSGCGCDAGFAPDATGNSCTASQGCDTIAAANTFLGKTFQGGTFKSLQFCNGGCAMTASNGYGIPGDWSLTGTFTATGASCTGDGNAGTDVQPKPSPLPAGKCPGTVNGTAVVVPCDTTVTNEATKATSADKSASGATSVGTETVTSKTVTCEGGNCTTTTTTTKTNPDGSGGTSTEKKTEPKPQDSFCKENPNLRICKESSATSSCAGGTASTQCDGDAVQCLIVREQLRRQCEFFDRTNAATDAATQAAAAGVGGGADHPARHATSQSIGTFDQTDLLPGSCPADRTVMVGTAVVTLPFSKVCTPANQLGSLLVALTALACVAIVFKGA